MLTLIQFVQGLRNYLLGLVKGSNPMVEQANKAKRWLVAISTVASSLADKVSHNNKQLCSKYAAEALDTEHQWACRDVLETIEAIPYHEVGDYDRRGL